VRDSATHGSLKRDRCGYSRTALTIQTGNSGLILGQPGEPRMVGVAFRFAKN